MQLLSKSPFILITYIALFSACGNPNSDRFIVLPEAKTNESLSVNTKTWTLYSRNNFSNNQPNVRYQLDIVAPSTNDLFEVSELRGKVSNIDTKNVAIEKVELTQVDMASSSDRIIYKDFNYSETENPILVFAIDPISRSCLFSWQIKVDTNLNKYEEVIFEGTCK